MILHFKEARSATNTGHFAHKMLKNSSYFVRGLSGPQGLSDNQKVENFYSQLSGSHDCYIVFPLEDSTLLTPTLALQNKKPLALIVPDGNWGQARRSARRIQRSFGFGSLSLSPGNTSERLSIRKETRPEGRATLDAVSRVLGIVEGPDVEKSLQEFYQELHRRVHLSRRGQVEMTSS